VNPRETGAGGLTWARVRQVLVDAIRVNLNLKIIAAALAVVAWLLVQGRPTAEEYATIQLAYTWPDALVLSGEPVNQVLVKAVGPRANLRELSRRELRYAIDLSDAAPGVTTLNLTGMPVQELPAGLEITTISPSSLSFNFDERLVKALQVKVPTRGEPAYGFEVAEIVIEPNVVALSGAAPDLEPLEEIRTRPLDMNGRDRNFAEILALDLGAIRARPEHDAEVSVYVRLNQIVEERELEVPITIPDALGSLSIEPSHATVTLHGPARELHRVMSAGLKVYLEPGDLVFKDGVARAPYAADAGEGGRAFVKLAGDGLPSSVEVRSVKPDVYSVRRVP